MQKLVLLEELEPNIIRLTLNRPEAANSFSVQLLEEWLEALEVVKKRRDVHVVIIKGAGNRIFSAGADLKERRTMTTQQANETVEKVRSAIQRTEDLPQPVLACMNGTALGGGLELALACDIRIAAKEGKYGLTETALAIVPGAGGTQRLPRLIGKGKAKELIYTARKLSGEEAAELGLCEYAVASSSVEYKALDLARKIRNNGPVAVRAVKRAVDQGIDLPLAQALDKEEEAYKTVLHTKDRLEGLQAFKEKRPPQYTGE
ncbi:enoyl-CoA hydratase-related protein [Salsuginibacillus kocurii]|uniref:enoyl-CoA hydratase-related protein n=1 Tax=Salsuginibacillus kocurii TaxID=427078 RepID=UPI00037753E0|nr:enoyl-CoA hydratase-related protein [Salsuginibacillus kocurii]